MFVFHMPKHFHLTMPQSSANSAGYIECYLKEHCHYDFTVLWSKLLKYLTKNLFANMKLLLEHREENIKGFLQERTNYNQFLTTSLKYTRRT